MGANQVQPEGVSPAPRGPLRPVEGVADAVGELGEDDPVGVGLCDERSAQPAGRRVRCQTRDLDHAG